jgi:hypothetical protein
MPMIKLKSLTIDIIDAMFALNEKEIARDESMDHETQAELLEKLQKAKMDWLGYKTFIGM